MTASSCQATTGCPREVFGNREVFGSRHRVRGGGQGGSARHRCDAGVATVLACVCAMALIAITGLAVQFGAVVLARHRAENAADLGALAGAAVVLQGQQGACARAGSVTAANGATVSECVVEGADLLLTVTVAVRLGPLSATATGRARAGPVVETTR